ncbi:hypothetical protein OG884_22645 [Streptosporangium sp. NBC_01755]|uniref:hypothetical protein n=1 Tax=unclassified Streptosporangium TaxID=2632669 RepID=UPI002DD9AD7A|nr:MULTISPECIES: hypothetical protein [unclassified Streptosporangium]WSA24237.1 hypothetical protein OIE13_25275 [Streptosporangium sp. NBC_01810]WSC97688.1 hypothetical protein OG884_22645 [Streptosporangium sp. NBC_01755]
MADVPAWAARLRAARNERCWSQRGTIRRLAEAADESTRAHLPTRESLTRMLRAWESGKHRPNEPYPRLLARAFGVSEEKLFADSLDVPEPGKASQNSLIQKASDGDDDMERRRLLRLAAGAGIGILGISGEPVRQLLDLSLDHDFRSAEEWELAREDHLHALRTRPPAQVAADLIIDLLLVRRQMEVSPPAEVAELQRVLATLSAIHGNALTRLGDHGAAIRWWHTARHAADASGDREVRLLVRVSEAGTGLYGQRAPETVVRLIHDAERIAGEPSVGLMTTRAKALSLLGRHDDARTTLNALVDLAEKGAAGDSLGFWKPDQIHFAESWVYAGAGDEAKADAARENVLGFTPEYQYGTNVMLHEALCTVVNGGVDEGMQRAATVIDALSPAYRSRYIIETGRMLLRAVPPDQRNRPAIGEFREVLALEVVR